MLTIESCLEYKKPFAALLKVSLLEGLINPQPALFGTGTGRAILQGRRTYKVNARPGEGMY
jgi:hypothetical protein